jgi:serine/threonine-protein kinase HipA
MHLKNVSMINSTTGRLLAPAYDLLHVSILNPKDKEELALPIIANKSKLWKKHLLQFATHLVSNQKTTGCCF